MSVLPGKFPLPRGFRFHPTDLEIIDYLRSKNSGDDEVDFIPEISFYKSEPWDLPGKCSIPTVDSQWFFFAQPELKHRRGNRSNRLTEKGFWKPTGNDRKIMSGSRLIGTKKTLVFYEGRARKCIRTSWVIHEYRTDPYQINSFLICRLFDKREGPNGAGSSVQSPMTSQSHLDETNSGIALGSVSPSSEVQLPDFGTRTINDGFHAENSDAAISDATPAVENQSAQDTFAGDEQLSLSEEDFEFRIACLQEPVDATELKEGMNLEKYLEPLKACLQEPVNSNLSTSLPNSPAVSTPTAAKSSLEEAKSEIVVASVPPAQGDGTYNYLPRRCPEKSVAGTTCNTIPCHCQNGHYTATDQLAVVTATELKEGMDREKVSPAYPEVSPDTNDVNSSHGGVGLQNGMNENDAYWNFISLDDLDDNFGNESAGQKTLASGFDSNAEHGQVPWQPWANNPPTYSPECWESVFHNTYAFPPIDPLGGSSNQIVGSD